MSGHEPGEMGLTAAELEVIALRNRVRELEAERDAARRYHEGACRLVAQMHAAAMGEVTGPRVGPVEDVAALRTERDFAKAEFQIANQHLAESQAREQELRAALRKGFPCGRISHDHLTCHLHPGHDGFHESDDGARVHWPDSEGVAWAKLPDIISAPSDQTALREFGLKVASAVDKAVGEPGHQESLVAIVDAVLKGAP